MAAKSSFTTTVDPPMLDSGESVIMFRDRQETTEKTYMSGSYELVQLAAGQKKIECNGEGTIALGK